MSDYEIYEIPAFTLQSGVTLDLKLAYKTYGKLTRGRDNVIVMPTYYGGRHTENEVMIATGRAIDTSKYFVVMPNMFGNGYSSSPDNTPAPYGRGAFPMVSLYDNVVCQHRLLTEHLKVKQIRLVAGFSMGAMQAFQWGALYPDLIDAIAPICGAAKISEHNHLFVDSAVSALRLDPDFKDGWYDAQPIRGVLTFGKVYAAWLFSQDFMRDKHYRDLGLAAKRDVVLLAQNYFLKNDANNLLTMAETWLNGDISANPVFKGDFKRALRAIRARAIVMPCDTDLYFRVADNRAEVRLMPNAECRPISSPWGHGVGFGLVAADNAFMDKALRELLK
ncbi:MAG: alpha/beta fold hydrolase [Gammaproteobacteria bacterium]|nr:alpha/beta fold hydrolase [Gammaproteobacteria bacterium]